MRSRTEPRRKPAAIWAVLVATMLVMAACTSAPSPGQEETTGPSAGGSGAPTETDVPEYGLIKIAITAESGVSVTPGRVAIERLQERGYEVESQLYPDPITAMQAVIVGEADIGTADSYVVIQANEAG